MFTKIFSVLRSLIAILFSFISNSILVTLLLTIFVLVIDTHKWGWMQSLLRWLGRPVNPDNAFGIFFTIFLVLPFILSPTRFMAWLLAKFNGWKTAQGADNDLIQSGLNSILSKGGLKEKRYHLYVAETPELNAAAFGRDNILVTRGLINNVKERPDILEGILSHEIGHLHYGHSLVLSFILVMDTCGELSIEILKKIIWLGGKMLSWIPIVNIFFAIVAWTVAIIFIIVGAFRKITYYITLWFYRQDEHAADNYACNIGFGNELLDGLKLLKEYSGPDEKQGVLANLGSDHPSLLHRIETIQKYLDKHQSVPVIHSKNIE